MSDRTAIATNAILKNLLTDAVVDRGSQLVDFNTCLTAGVYRYGPQTLNIPEGVYQYGIAVVFATVTFGQDYVAQMAIPDSMVDAAMLIRTYWVDQFRPWRTIKPSL